MRLSGYDEPAHKNALDMYTQCANERFSRVAKYSMSRGFPEKMVQKMSPKTGIFVFFITAIFRSNHKD